MDFLGLNESGLRLVAFLCIFAVMASLELLIPKRPLRVKKPGRWTTNLGIVVLNSLLIRVMANLAVPIAAVAAAFYAEATGIGLFSWLDWPAWLEIAIVIAALDFALWFQHLVSHKVTVLWRLHQMHHADPDIDVTTAIRFHPIEIGLSMVWKIGWVLALGAAPLAVLLFEILLNGVAMFNHANIDLPQRLDRLLRLLIVTPDMHRIHHSTERHEHDSNFGFNLSIWDRLFRTYTDQPAKGHRGMSIGLASYPPPGPTKLLWNLKIPFRPLPKDH